MMLRHRRKNATKSATQLAEFISECCIIDSGSTVDRIDLYKAYWDWAWRKYHEADGHFRVLIYPTFCTNLAKLADTTPGRVYFVQIPIFEDQQRRWVGNRKIGDGKTKVHGVRLLDGVLTNPVPFV